MNPYYHLMTIPKDDEDPELRFYKIMTGEIPIENESQRKDYEESYCAMNMLIPQYTLFEYLEWLDLIHPHVKDIIDDWRNLDMTIIKELSDAFRVNMPLLLAKLYDYYCLNYRLATLERLQLKTRLDKALVLYK